MYDGQSDRLPTQLALVDLDLGARASVSDEAPELRALGRVGCARRLGARDRVVVDAQKALYSLLLA